jgi:hypothetical protein
MSLVVAFESQDTAQVAPTFTLRPKPDRRRTPRVVLGPGMGPVCFIGQETQSAPAGMAPAPDRRNPMAVA